MKNEFVGGIAILFWILVFGFVAKYWQHMLLIGVGLAVLFGIACVVGFGIEHLKEFLQKRKDALPPQPVVLGRVKVDGGVAVLTRTELSKYYHYPCVLALSNFNYDGRLTSSRATYLTCGEDEGRVIAGMRGWQPVYVNTRAKADHRIISMSQLDGKTVWQTHPPADQPVLTLTTSHLWRNI